MSLREHGPMRELMSLGVIIAGAVVGLQLLAGDPLRLRAERAHRAVDAAQTRLNEVADPSPLAAGDLATLDELRRRARAIAASNERAADQLQVYAAVTAIAAECAVQIDRMEPTSGGERDETGAVRSQAYEISALADFPSFVAFLDRMQSDAGYARVISFTLEPQAVDGQPALRATIRTLHYAFDLGEASRLVGPELAAGAEEPAQ